jgi:hypothetical protein
MPHETEEKQALGVGEHPYQEKWRGPVGISIGLTLG